MNVRNPSEASVLTLNGCGRLIGRGKRVGSSRRALGTSRRQERGWRRGRQHKEQSAVGESSRHSATPSIVHSLVRHAAASDCLCNSSSVRLYVFSDRDRVYKIYGAKARACRCRRQLDDAGGQNAIFAFSHLLSLHRESRVESSRSSHVVRRPAQSLSPSALPHPHSPSHPATHPSSVVPLALPQPPSSRLVLSSAGRLSPICRQAPLSRLMLAGRASLKHSAFSQSHECM